MGQHDSIIVVGGGLGGLTAALALAQSGHTVRILEGAEEFGAIGYGIQFGPNVFHVFDRRGLSTAVLEQADTPPGVIMVDAHDGHEVIRVPTGQPSFRRRFNHPYIIIHRADLHRVLLDACARSDRIELVTDAVVTRFDARAGSVTANTMDGRTFVGAALIGADGVRSRIRAQLFADGDPQPIGFVSHRTIVPMAQVPPQVNCREVVLWAGPGFHIVHYPLRHGALFNIVAVFRTSSYAERGEVEHYRADLQYTYRDAHPTMKALLSMMDLSRRWTLGVRDPIRVWHQGPVALLGDAAHPTLQSLAQGACMAIEDGLCVADCIHRAGGDFDAAFRHYERARCVRTARVTLESNFIWEAYHAGGIAREVHWQMLGERSEHDVLQCLAWLYDGFHLADDTGPSMKSGRM
jgi:salicylate hydroxylase